jgi:hypothetical protein
MLTQRILHFYLNGEIWLAGDTSTGSPETRVLAPVLSSGSHVLTAKPVATALRPQCKQTLFVNKPHV